MVKEKTVPPQSTNSTARLEIPLAAVNIGPY
jgi:hypothetical protein